MSCCGRSPSRAAWARRSEPRSKAATQRCCSAPPVSGRSASKAALGRAGFAFDPEEIARAALETGFIELAVHWNAAALVGRLPLLHRDPFDRVIVAQAIVEPATLYTADPQLVPYSELVRRIGTF
jgi:hypothetical protein